MQQQKQLDWKGYHSTGLNYILNIKHLETNYWVRVEGNKIIGLWTNTYTTRQVHSLDDPRTKVIFHEIMSRLRLHGWKGFNQYNFSANRCEYFATKALSIVAKSLPKYSQKLDAVKLDFERCPDIIGDGLKNLGLQICKNLPYLKKVAISFSWCSLQDKGIIQFLKQTSYKLKRLSNLELDLNACYITDVGARYLSSHLLKKIRALKQLKLSFGWNHQISKRGFESLFGSIGHNLIQLNSLALNFQYCSLNDIALDTFGMKTKNRLKSLQSLQFNLNSCKSITSKGFGNLGLHLGQNFKQLQSLILICRECREISDQGIALFCEGIRKNLPPLRKLSLDFEKCGVSNNGLEELGSYFNHSELQEISLNFTYSLKLTDQGLKNLIQRVLIEDLRVLDLKFTGCVLLTSQPLKDWLNDTIEKFKSLKELRMDFFQCPLIHQDIKLSLQNSLKEFIPVCKIR